MSESHTGGFHRPVQKPVDTFIYFPCFPARGKEMQANASPAAGQNGSPIRKRFAHPGEPFLIIFPSEWTGFLFALNSI